jgi:hypothetical protein
LLWGIIEGHRNALPEPAFTHSYSAARCDIKRALYYALRSNNADVYRIIVDKYYRYVLTREYENRVNVCQWPG